MYFLSLRIKHTHPFWHDFIKKKINQPAATQTKARNSVYHRICECHKTWMSTNVQIYVTILQPPTYRSAAWYPSCCILTPSVYERKCMLAISNFTFSDSVQLWHGHMAWIHLMRPGTKQLDPREDFKTPKPLMEVAKCQYMHPQRTSVPS